MTFDNPFLNASSQQNIGGVLSLRLYLSSNIVQQTFQTTNQLEDLLLLYNSTTVGIWRAKDKMTGELKVMNVKSEKGRKESFEFSATIESDVDPQAFEEWFEKIKGKNLCLLIENVNGYHRAFNPFHLNYSYVGVSDYGQRNRYELSFTRARFFEYAYQPINDVLFAEGKEYHKNDGTVIHWTEVSVKLNQDVNIDSIEFWIGTNNNFDKAKKINAISKKENGNYWIANKEDGEYWLFAVYTNKRSIYQRLKLNISSEESDFVLQ